MVSVQADGAPRSCGRVRRPRRRRRRQRPHHRRRFARAGRVGDFLMLRALRESGGTALAVTDAAMVDGMRRLGREGISAAPEGGAALAALDAWSPAADRPRRVVVLFNTGGALKYLEVPEEEPPRPDTNRTLDRTETTDPTPHHPTPPPAFSTRHSSTSVAEATPMARAVRTTSSRRHGARLADDVFERNHEMSGGWNATILSSSPLSSSSTALPPKRVASMRSKRSATRRAAGGRARQCASPCRSVLRAPPRP